MNVVVWRGQAENCHKFLKKGSKCGVVGRIQTSSFEGQDGNRRYVTEIIADEVEFLSTKQSGDGASVEVKEEPKKVAELEPIDDDTLPF